MFLSPSFWIFALVTCIIIFVLGPKNIEQRVVYYMLLLCAVPNVSALIPGFAGINLFYLSYSRILIFLLLVPLLFYGKQHTSNRGGFLVISDRFIVLFLLLESLLAFRDNTTTNALRESFLLFVDIFIPYYAISRYVNSQEQFRNIFFVILIAITPFALIGIFETLKHWHLYHEIRLLLSDIVVRYSSRSGFLRAAAVFESPIVLGYVLTIGFGALLFTKSYFENTKIFYLLAMLIIFAILATISRGTWLGFGMLVFVYTLIGKDGVKNLAIALMGFTISIPFISLTPYWGKFVELLPFFGSANYETISYRQRLIEQAWIALQRNPFFGSATYLDTQEMESMRQGQGIIDVVNTYVGIVLSTGLVGLTLFILIFLALLLGIYRSMKNLPDDEKEMIHIGRVLFSTLISILFMISTVSSIDYVPTFYWAFAGLSSAYIFLAQKIIWEPSSYKYKEP